MTGIAFCFCFVFKTLINLVLFSSLALKEKDLPTLDDNSIKDDLTQEDKDFIAHFETGMCESDTMAKFNDTLLSHCDICKMKFNGAEALEKHVQKFHLNKVNKRDICETMVNLGIIPKKDAFMAYFGLQRVVYYPNF